MTLTRRATGTSSTGGTRLFSDQALLAGILDRQVDLTRNIPADLGANLTDDCREPSHGAVHRLDVPDVPDVSGELEGQPAYRAERAARRC